MPFHALPSGHFRSIVFPSARKRGWFSEDRRAVLCGIIGYWRVRPLFIKRFFAMQYSVSFGPGRTALVPSRWRRFASMMYEGVLLFAVVFLAGYLFDTLTQSRSGLTLRTLRQIALF